MVSIKGSVLNTSRGSSQFTALTAHFGEIDLYLTDNEGGRSRKQSGLRGVVGVSAGLYYTQMECRRKCGKALTAKNAGETFIRMPIALGTRTIKALEVCSYAAGAALFGFFAVQLAQGEVERQSGISQFHNFAQATQTDAAVGDATPAGDHPAFAIGDSTPDTALWAPGRIADYQASLKADLPPVIGVLELPSVGLSVPLYPTDSELAMDRGAGIIDGMAYPHEGGNIGIAGHRDGYFRVLKDVKVGDALTLETLEGPKQFRIDNIRVVEIEDTDVLEDTDDQTVTLVTCYPFYFVGHAPQRYIVTASLDTTNVNQQ